MDQIIFRKGDYLLEDNKIINIKKGGQGIVYFLQKSNPAQWEPEILCAKALRDEFLNNEKYRRVFVEECQTWLSLERYDHITQAVEFRRIHDQPFIFMEYVPEGSARESLNGLLNSNSKYISNLAWLSENIDQRRNYLRISTLLGIARGMNYFHNSTKQVHCDLKPENILIWHPSDRVLIPTESIKQKDDDFIGMSYMIPQGFYLVELGQWLTKVTDFGLSRPEGEKSLGCTPRYAAPEQLDNKGFVDKRTDLYGFGATAYFVLFNEEPPIRGCWKEPYQGTGTIPSLIIDLIRSCLSVDRRDRPHSFSNVIDVLYNFIKNEYGIKVDEKSDAEIIKSEINIPLESIEEVEEVESQHAPIDPNLPITLGDNLLLSDAPDIALKYYQRALSSIEDPFWEEEKRKQLRELCNERIGLSYWFQGQNSLAEEFFRKGIFPGIDKQINASMFVGKGLTASEFYNDLMLSLIYFLAASCMKKNDPSIYYNMGVTELRLGNVIQAGLHFKKAIENQNASSDSRIAGKNTSEVRADYYRMYGECIRRQGKLHEALEQFRKAYQLTPENTNLAHLIEELEKGLD
jgi:serine/threonine protein kinase